MLVEVSVQDANTGHLQATKDGREEGGVGRGGYTQRLTADFYTYKYM